MRIDLEPTRRLHHELRAFLPDSAARLRAEIEEANRRIRARGITFGGEKEMPVALSALLLRRADVDRIDRAARTLHGILEQVIDALAGRPEWRERWGSDHRRMFPHLRKSAGSNSWQLFSRYDIVPSAKGELKFIEANTGCPAGFMHAADFTRETAHILESLAIPSHATIAEFGMIRPGALIELLLAAERRSGMEPGLIAILYDENELRLELDLIEAELKARGRTARIIDARTLEWDGAHLSHRGDRISLTFNKLRVSTAGSPNHCWKEGFATRYAAMLAAFDKGAVVAVNGLCALTLAEDKGLFSLLHEPEVRAILSAGERSFIDETVPWTARVRDGEAYRHGDRVDLGKLLRDRPEEFVLKPANEGRGFNVLIGGTASHEEWNAAIKPDPHLPRVAQEFVEPASFDVACLREGKIHLARMHLTIALAVLDGRYEGILSRISPNLVTNVGRQGFVQAVFTIEGDPRASSA